MENRRDYFTKRFKKVVKDHFTLGKDYGLYSFRHTYITTRKGVQKFCSSSCRSRFWFLKKQKETTPSIAQQNLEKVFGQKN